MSGGPENRAITGLRWVLGIIVAWQSMATAWAAYPEIHTSGHHGAHAWIRLILGSIETLGAGLLLWPRTIFLSGWILLAVFSFAVLFHALQGEFNLGALLVYGAATIVCMAQAKVPRR
jgi:hypothetical protein